ncbi:hypothetical protein MHI24_07020 [Paenibacillus sp. FSL K6-1096]|uniref:hypothetical protein n=1 Tax=Paenibacillus sp. FSL K6-1096 TaxID=2921460 RepID=UPI0030EF2692
MTGVTGTTGPILATEGFSVFLPTLVTGTTATFTGWEETAPYYGNAAFDQALGEYTVPEAGRYSVEATVNFAFTAAIVTALGPDVNPSLVVQRTTPAPVTNLVTGLLPVLDVNVGGTTLRAPLRSGTVTLAGEVELAAGDVISLIYQSNGLAVDVDLGATTSGVVWSVHRLT